MPLLTLDPTALLRDFRAGPATSVRTVRIAVFGGAFIHKWEQEFCEWLAELPGLDVHNVLWQVEEAAARKPRALRKPGWFFDRLYRYSRVAFDAFAQVEFRPAASSESGAISSLDVAIWLPSLGLPEGSCASLARLGVLSFRLGLGNHSPPYWDESSRRETVSRIEICWHDRTFHRARTVASAEVSTYQGILFTRNSRRPLAAAAHLAASVCLEMLCNDASWVSEASRIPEEACPRVQPPFPTTLQAAGFVANMMVASAARRREERGRREAWFIALHRRNSAQNCAQSGVFVPGGLEPVPMTRGWDMADPFLLEDGGRTWLFFEEVLEWRGKGRLACLEILDGGKFTPPEVILERDYHLSYPCIFRHDGEIFMIPETHQAGRIDLYRATRFPLGFRLEKTCLEGLAARDTTPVFWENHWYFFTTINRPLLQTLLFWSDRLEGEWRLHPKSPISTSVRGGRPAGAILQVNGRLLRPAQDCSVRYGYAIVINEVKTLTPTEFAEEPVDLILPSWRPGLLGTHTLNHSHRFEVLDGSRLRP